MEREIMKSIYRNGFGVVAALMLAGAWSVSHAQSELCDTIAATTPPQSSSAIASAPISETQCITPYIVQPADGNDRGGNRSCADVGKAYFGNPLYYLCRSEKRDYPGDFDINGDATFGPDSGLPDDCENSIQVNTDGTFVSWSSHHPIGAAIIKGGPAANTYVYEPQVDNDFGLASPTNPGEQQAGLSNIGGFCWNPEEMPPDECFADETAWAANGTKALEKRYTREGNWATYVEYKEKTKTVTIFAGRTMNVGTAVFSVPSGDDKVTITITLTGDWVFGVNYELDGDGNPKLDGDGNPIRDANIKIQDYSVAPSGNPAPGLFDHKFVGNGQSAVVEVPANKFYGVHLDVAVPVDCP
jgi:hypothetical protein